MKNELAPVTMAITNLTHKTVTNHEIMKKNLTNMERNLSTKMDENIATLTTEMNKTGNKVTKLVEDLRTLTNFGDKVDEANMQNSEIPDPVVELDRIPSPETYRQRIKKQDPLKLDAFLRREEVIFLIQNFHDQTKVPTEWVQLLESCRDPITFLSVVFEDFTFDPRLTSATWTHPEVIDDATGK